MARAQPTLKIGLLLLVLSAGAERNIAARARGRV